MAVLAGAVACGAETPGHLRGFDLSRATMSLADGHPGGPPKDGIAALTNPEVVSATDAPTMGDADRHHRQEGPRHALEAGGGDGGDEVAQEASDRE